MWYEMKLAEYFIMQLNQDKSPNGVYRAIEEVNEIFSDLLYPDTSEEECINYFFENKNNKLCPKETYYEIIELWEMIEPYVWTWKRQELTELWVLDMIVEAEIVKQVSEYNEILDCETKDHVQVLNELANSIEDIFHKKYMVELIIDKSDIIVKKIYSLRYFDEECYHPYRDFLMQKLYCNLKEGGIIIVVAGSLGLTPRRIFEYSMKNFVWKMKGIKSQKIRKIVLQENLEIRRSSLIPGYILDDLW